jgi:hypothetical protein
VLNEKKMCDTQALQTGRILRIAAERRAMQPVSTTDSFVRLLRKLGRMRATRGE